METRHPVEGLFGGEFSAICNHCGIMPAWSRKTLTIFEKFLCFFGKRTPYGKIFKILFRKLLSRHRSMFCFQISWNLADGKLVKSCVAYLTKRQNFVWLSSCRCWAPRTRNLPWPAPNNVLRFLQISSKSVHFRRSYSLTREGRQVVHKLNPIFGRSLSSSRIINQITR